MTNVARVWWWYLFHGTDRAASMRAASAAAAKALGASEAPLCKACRNMEKLGKKNGEAHLRVPPCTWVRMAPAPRKKRALETPAAAAVAEREAELAPAVTCSCVCLVGLTQSSGSAPVLRQDKQTTARAMLARLDSEVRHRLLFAEDRTAVHEAAHRVRPHEVGCAIPTKQLLLVLVVWAAPRKKRNQEQHALNGGASPQQRGRPGTDIGAPATAPGAAADGQNGPEIPVAPGVDGRHARPGRGCRNGEHGDLVLSQGGTTIANLMRDQYKVGNLGIRHRWGHSA